MLLGGGVWRSLDAGRRTGSQYGFVRIFITPTDSILSIAPGIIRRYGISFLLLPFSIFSTYYFQAMMKPSTAFVVSVSRGAVISGILIYLLPVIAGVSGIWFTMPITELGICGGHDAALSEAADQVTAERIFRHIFPVP